MRRVIFAVPPQEVELVVRAPGQPAPQDGRADRVMEGGSAFGQLAAPLEGGGFAVPAVRLFERGARAAVLHVPGLFRFDLMPGRDAASVSLRELCDAPMRWGAGSGTIDGIRRAKDAPMVFRGGIRRPDARLSIGMQALSAADEDQDAVHVVATAAVRVA